MVAARRGNGEPYAALGQGSAGHYTVTAGTVVVTVPAPSAPFVPRSLKIENMSATAFVVVAINENPTMPANDPPAANERGVGYRIKPGATELIPLSLLGSMTTTRFLASANGTVVYVSELA